MKIKDLIRELEGDDPELEVQKGSGYGGGSGRYRIYIVPKRGDKDERDNVPDD